MKRWKALLAVVLTLSVMLGCITPVFALGIFESDAIDMPDEDNFVLEAEDERITLNSKKFYPQDDPEASGGQMICGQGSWMTDQPPTEQEGDLKFTINISEPGVYTFWLRLDNINDTQVSLWQRLDGSKYQVYWANGAEASIGWFSFARKYLSAGEHTMEIVPRDTGTRYDSFLISKLVSFTPQGVSGLSEIEEFDVGEFYNAPPVTPPENQHPRVMFTEKDIPQIKNAIETMDANKLVYERLLSLADMDTDCILDPIDVEAYNGNSKMEGHIESCAFLYALDKEKNLEYGKTAIQHYYNYTKNYICTSAKDNQTRFLGDMVRIGAEVYDWCYDLLTDEDKENFYGIIMAYVSGKEIGWPPTQRSNYNSHAGESELLADLMSFAIATYDEYPYIWDVTAGRLYQELIPAQEYEYGYGAMPEGTDYSLVRVQNDYYCMWLLKRMGYENQFNDESLEQLVYTAIMRYQANGMTLREGDCWNVTPGSAYTVTYAVFLHWTYFKNPYSRYYYNMCGGGNGYPMDDSGNGALCPWLYLALATEEVEAKSWDDLPLTYHYGNGDESVEDGMVIRSNWTEGGALSDKYGYNIGIVYSPYMMGGHQHCHSGSFQIAYGSYLALDSGTYSMTRHVWYHPKYGDMVDDSGWGSYAHQNYVTAGIAHNIMLIRGDDTKRLVYQSHNSWKGSKYEYEDDGGQIGASATVQNERTGVPDGTFHAKAKTKQITLESALTQNTVMLGWDAYPNLQEPEYTYISGDLTYAYPAARVDSYFRSFVYLNLNDEKEERTEGALLVYDNMKAETNGLDKVWLLHTEEKPSIDGTRVTLQRTERDYDGRLINDTLLPEKPTIELVGGEGHEFDVNGINIERGNSKPLQEVGKWRVEIGNSENQLQDDFMNVIQIGREGAPIYDTELVQNDDYFVGSLIKDKAVFMSKSKTKYKKTLEIGIDENKEGEFSYIVTGVAKGKWAVKQDGKTIATYEVADDHPTLTFKAPAGTYRLEWNYLKDDPERDMTFMGNVVEKGIKKDRVKIDAFYWDFDNPVVQKNGTQWLNVKELIKYIGFGADEYEFSEDGRSLTLLGNTMTVSDDPDETNALIMIDGEMYVPIINLDTEFSCRAYWFPISRTVRIDMMNRVSADDKARLYNYDIDGFLLPKQITVSYSDASTNPYNTVDNNTGTYYFAGELNDWMKVEFKEPTSITTAEIIWHSNASRSMSFEILVSPDDENWTSVYTGNSDMNSEGFETYKLAPNSGSKYVKVVGHGNTNNDKMSISEMRFFNN